MKLIKKMRNKSSPKHWTFYGFLPPKRFHHDSSELAQAGPPPLSSRAQQSTSYLIRRWPRLAAVSRPALSFSSGSRAPIVQRCRRIVVVRSPLPCFPCETTRFSLPIIRSTGSLQADKRQSNTYLFSAFFTVRAAAAILRAISRFIADIHEDACPVRRRRFDEGPPTPLTGNCCCRLSGNIILLWTSPVFGGPGQIVLSVYLGVVVVFSLRGF